MLSILQFLIVPIGKGGGFLLAHLSTKCSRVSFCDHSASVVLPLKNGVKLLQQQLLLNKLANIIKTKQECSLQEALEFNSMLNFGRHGKQKKNLEIYL
jgi:hypothetical protein